MNSNSVADSRILNELDDQVKDALYGLGLLCRIFPRIKQKESLFYKLENKKDVYSANGKRMQDYFGIRIVLYFADDSDIAQNVLRSLYGECVDVSVDDGKDTIFGPTRCNLVFKLPQKLVEQSSVLREMELIDTTFEAQFRTVFSEGWHEVEHDLRYKRANDWSESGDLSRLLNGVMATLENCDWSLLKIFDELALRHYRNSNVEAMVQAKFRLKMQRTPLEANDLWLLLKNENDIRKKIFRVDRLAFLTKVLALRGKMHNHRIPINAFNVIHLCNRLLIDEPAITKYEPQFLTELFERVDIQSV